MNYPHNFNGELLDAIHADPTEAELERDRLLALVETVKEKIKRDALFTLVGFQGSLKLDGIELQEFHIYNDAHDDLLNELFADVIFQIKEKYL